MGDEWESGSIMRVLMFGSIAHYPFETMKVSVADRIRLRLEQGPVMEIFRAEQALAIHRAIGERARKINATDHREPFATLQHHALGNLVLAITKLYEGSRDRRSNSLPKILDIVLVNRHALKIRHPKHVEALLGQLGYVPPNLASLPDESKNLILHHRLINAIPDNKRNRLLNALRAWRDKSIAHSENRSVESLPMFSLNGIETLLRPAKVIVGVLGAAYLNQFFLIDHRYVLDEDARRVGGSMRAFLDSWLASSTGMTTMTRNT